MWLRRLSTDRIERRLSAPHETAHDTPRVVIASIEQAQRIVAMNDAAAKLRLKPDMPLADARAMYPSLPVFEADFEADRNLLEAVAGWCDRYTPLVGTDPPDGLFLDITGCAHLFNGEATLARDLLTRLRQQGFTARAAVADTPGCAWGVARYGRQGIVPRGGNEAAMLPLPVAALRADAGTVADLKTAGLVTVGDLASRPRAPFVARFGKELMLRLDQALGRADESIRPRLPVPMAMAEQRFPDPIAREEDVLGTIEQLAGRLATVLERRGEGGRLFQVALFRADGTVHRLELGTGSPLRDPPRVRRLFAERLAVLGDACDPGFGYDMVRLSAMVTERSDSTQTGLAGGDHADELAHLVDRLGARFGLRRVTRLVPQDTHIPEYAVAAVPAHAPAAFLSAKEQPDDRGQDSLFPVRPLHLLERPEFVEAVAQVPDGPPARFSWRRTMHHVVRVEGPERIEMQWWRDDRGNRLARDYFRVESRAGLRAWLYREGFYSRQTPHPHWYLHGLFA